METRQKVKKENGCEGGVQIFSNGVEIFSMGEGGGLRIFYFFCGGVRNFRGMEISF